MLLAVLEKRGGYQFSGQDVYLNIAGGLKLNDTAGDLGVMGALVSSLLDKPLSDDAVFLGEAGLGGELRAVNRIDQRLSEIQKLGFTSAFIPKSSKIGKAGKNLSLTKVGNSIEAIKKAL
jgi:DNA repair protein RadA/Sms